VECKPEKQKKKKEKNKHDGRNIKELIKIRRVKCG